MITQKKYNIPIFDYKLTVIIYDNWDEVKHNFDRLHEPKGITRMTFGSSLVAINSKSESTIVHEAEHVKNGVWEFIGYTPQAENDEVDAYLLTYIYDKIIYVFRKHNEK